MSAVAAIVVGGGAALAGAGATAALVAGGVAGAASMYSGAKKQAKAAAASQERAAEGLASASDYAADLSYKLGQEQLDFAKQQYRERAPHWPDKCPKLNSLHSRNRCGRRRNTTTT